MLYSITIEPLLHNLHSNLRGLSVPYRNDQFYLSAYADDVIAFVNDEEDLHRLESTVQEFQLLSSARVNWGKSKVLLIG